MTDIIPIKVVPLWVKVVAILALAIFLFGGFGWTGWRLRNLSAENAALKANQDALLNRVSAEEAKNARQDQIFAARDEKQNEERAAVADVTVRIKQEAAHDPGTRSFLSARLPDGLRAGVRKAAAARSAAECKGADCPDAH